MTHTEQPTDSKPPYDEDNVLGASFMAIGPEGGVVVVQGPPAHVWVAHAVLFMHGFRLVPRAGEFWGPSHLKLWSQEEASIPLVQTAAGLIEQVLDETAHARPIYFYEYLD